MRPLALQEHYLLEVLKDTITRPTIEWRLNQQGIDHVTRIRRRSEGWRLRVGDQSMFVNNHRELTHAIDQIHDLLRQRLDSGSRLPLDRRYIYHRAYRSANNNQLFDWNDK